MRLALLRGLVAAAFAAVCVVAWAGGSAGPPQSVPQFGRNGHTGTAAEVCNALAADDQALTSPGHTVTAQIEGAEPTAGTTPFCRKYVDGGATGFGWYEFPIDSIVQCPANSTVGSDGNCQCNPGYAAGSGTCTGVQPHTCPAAGTTVPHPDSERSRLPGAHSGVAPPVCNNGCAETSNKVNVGTSPMDSYGYGDATSLGRACGDNYAAGGRGPSDAGGSGSVANSAASSAPDADPTPPETAQCTGATACWGTVNGTVVCTACPATATTATKTSTSTDANGVTTGSETATTVRDNLDGTTTTTTTTTRSDGSTSTTVSTKPGGSGATGTGTGGGTGTCVGSNCGGGGPSDDSFGGSCTTSFVCTGDAVQCAIAKEQHVRSCQAFEPATQGGDWAHGAQTLATAKADGDIPSWSPSHPGNAVETGFNWSTTIDHSSSFAASCPADVPIGSSGRVLPLAWLCPYFGVIGVLIESVTAVFCLVILFKGK